MSALISDYIGFYGRILMLAILLAICVQASSQHLNHRLYTVADGLVQSEVITIHQDKKGFIWAGTKMGLSRFDGIRFETITDSLHVLSSAILFIADMNEDHLAVLTRKGYAIISHRRGRTAVKSATLAEPILGKWIRNQRFEILQNIEKKTRLISIGFNSYEESYPDWTSEANHPDENKKWAFINYSPAEDCFYVLNKNGSLWYIKNGREKQVDIRLPWFPFNDSRGFLYTFSPHFLSFSLSENRMKKNKISYSSYDDSISLFRLREGKAEKIFDFGKDRSVLQSTFHITSVDTFHYFNFKTRQITFFSNGERRSYKIDLQNISGWLTDKEGNIWAGGPLGLSRLIFDGIEFYTRADGLYPNVQFVSEDHNGDIITGGMEDGVQVLHYKQFKTVDFPAESKSMHPINVYPGGGKDHQGNVYVTTSPYTAFLWDGKNLTRAKDYPPYGAFYFFEDPSDYTRYIGTDVGLLIHPRSGPHRILPIYPGDKTNKIVAIVKNRSGRFFLGGFHGLSFFDGDKATPLPNAEFPYDLGANAMAVDSLNNLWIGNNDGLWYFDNKKFRRIENPYFNDLIASIQIVPGNHLFIGGLRGFGFVDLADFYSTGLANIRYFDRDNGHNGEECQQNGVFTDRYGKIWVVTLNSLMCIDPVKLLRPLPAPDVHITGISIITPGLSQEPVTEGDYSFGGGISLAYDRNNIRIDYAGLGFHGPTHVRYKIRLKGYSDQWSEETAERFAVYTNLKPGRYTFEVMACNDAGVWSEKPARVDIAIVPAFWQRSWFTAMVILLPLLIAVGITVLIMRNLRVKKQRALEQSKAVADLRFRALRNQLAPHFIFNALNAIGASIFQNDKDASYNLLHKFSKLIRHTLTHPDQSFRTLAEEIEFVKYYLEIEKIRFDGKIDAVFDIPHDADPTILVPRNIIQTFAENSVKHGLLHKEGPGLITILIRVDDGHLLITVTDDGIGRSAALRYKGESTGRGMEIIREYIDLLNNFNEQKMAITVSDLFHPDGADAGTKVVVAIPLKYSYVLTNEKDHNKNGHHQI